MDCRCLRGYPCSLEDEDLRALIAEGVLREIVACRIETARIPVLDYLSKSFSAIGQNVRKARRHALRHLAVHMRYGKEFSRTWSETGKELSVEFLVHYYGSKE